MIRLVLVYNLPSMFGLAVLVKLRRFMSLDLQWNIFVQSHSSSITIKYAVG